jgi:NADH-quinone oxidoreductase subunit N
MNAADLKALLPFIIMAVASVVVMLTIAFIRNHRLTVLLALAGLALSALSLPMVETPHAVTRLLLVDSFAIYYSGLILMGTFLVVSLSYSYLDRQVGHHEEFYLLLLIATLGAMILAASTHFASFFLGLEILSISLYALTGYQRHRESSIEAGIKYLILAGVSSAFILFGMALVYGEKGTMEFSGIAAGTSTGEAQGLLLITGLIMIVVGLGFKLAVVPFHLWTPDVYQGAPAPVTAFIATVSKGAVFALVLRFLTLVNLESRRPLFVIFTIIAIASMFAGNLLALLQRNVKRILAYSSISHLGYLFVTLLATGSLRISAAAFYVTAYFITTLGAFGVVTVLSDKERDADSLSDYRGLAWRKPWLAGVFTAMLLSLAGIPLTAGFVAKFYVVAAGVGSALWLLVAAVAINSAIGLFYYLRIVIEVYSGEAENTGVQTALSLSGSVVLIGLTFLLVWLGVYPGPVLKMIQKTMQSVL